MLVYCFRVSDTVFLEFICLFRHKFCYQNLNILPFAYTTYCEAGSQYWRLESRNDLLSSAQARQEFIHVFVRSINFLKESYNSNNEQ